MKIGSLVTVQLSRSTFENGKLDRITPAGKYKVVFADNTYNLFDPKKVKPALKARDKKALAIAAMERLAGKTGNSPKTVKTAPVAVAPAMEIVVKKTYKTADGRRCYMTKTRAGRSMWWVVYVNALATPRTYTAMASYGPHARDMVAHGTAVKAMLALISGDASMKAAANRAVAAKDTAKKIVAAMTPEDRDAAKAIMDAAERRHAGKTPANAAPTDSTNYLTSINPKSLNWVLIKMQTVLVYLMDGKIAAYGNRHAMGAPTAAELDRWKKEVKAKADKKDSKVIYLNGMNDQTLLRTLATYVVG